MQAFFIKLLFKLPKSLLIKWSGKDQIVKSYRKLDPGFQYLLKLFEDRDAQVDFKKPAAEVRKDFDEGRNVIASSLPSNIKTTDHFIQVDGAEIKIREYLSLIHI